MLALVALAGTLLAPAASAGPTACDALDPVELGGRLTEPRLIELSGMAASRVHPGVLWAHNDSGGAAELYAMAEDGTARGAFPVEGATAIDWEDIAAGPGPDGTGAFLYVGDIGDNDAARPSVTVFRVPEPDDPPTAPGVPLPGAEAIELVYPGGPADAEALLVDPRTGDLVIVTKSYAGRSRVLTTEARSLVPGAPVTLVDAGARPVPVPPDVRLGLPGTAVTSGDVAPDGSRVALRTYQSVLVFERAEGMTLAEALLGEPCFGPEEAEAQGEALAFTGDGTAYVTASEGADVPIQRVPLREPAVMTTTTEATTTSTIAPSDDAGADDDGAKVAVVVGAGLLLLVVGAAARWVRRRGSGVG